MERSCRGVRVYEQINALPRAGIGKKSAHIIGGGIGGLSAAVAAQAAGASFRILAEASTLRPDTRTLVVSTKLGITTITDLAGKKIGVNGTNSIGTLLISTLLQENGISPSEVHFVTDQSGFPAMPGQLQQGDWQAAFLRRALRHHGGRDLRRTGTRRP